MILMTKVKILIADAIYAKADIIRNFIIFKVLSINLLKISTFLIITHIYYILPYFLKARF